MEKKPEWLKVRYNQEAVTEVAELMRDLNLNTAEIIATYVYKKGLLDGDYSFSTAVGLFNTVVNVILLIAVNKVVAKMNDGKGL